MLHIHFIFITVSATNIHGWEACSHYDDGNPIDETYVGNSINFPEDGLSGTLTSPNYPYVYNNKMYCSWQFVLLPEQSIRLNITNMMLEDG